MWSGSHHLATRGSRKASRAALVAAVGCSSGRRTTQATGRSPQRASATPMTAASDTPGWAMSSFSSSTELIHSPPDLITSLARSTSRM